MRGSKVALFAAAVVGVACYRFCAQAGADVRPLYTSTRSVTAFATALDGSLWAATRGGVLHKSADGAWRKYTQADGLPSNEVFGARVEADGVRVSCPVSSAVFGDGKWREEPAEPSRPKNELCRVEWRGAICVATVAELKIVEGEKSRTVGLPPSTGSHISAMLARGDKLWVMMFGDGFWVYDGKNWAPADIKLPVSAREVTAIAESRGRLVVGTRREGIWEHDGKTWKQHLQPDEPYTANCQNVIQFKDMILISTLEDGLLVKRANGWNRYCSPELSSNAPRQMLEFSGSLYLRHGSGKVDCFDGRQWAKDVFRDLPRKQVSAIAADTDRMYAAQWGGWSEFDGKTWEHHLNIAELQGYPITALLADGKRMWVGTQGRGLAEVERTSGKVTWHDERHGLPDDWVKHLVKCGGQLYAGTFVGGLARWDGKVWQNVAQIGQCEITDLRTDPAGNLLAATRTGVWKISGDGTPAKLTDTLVPKDVDAQALGVADGRLWIGTRTEIWTAGLF